MIKKSKKYSVYFGIFRIIKIQHNLIMNEQKNVLRTSEASEVVFNEQTFNNAHTKLEKITFDSK